MLSRILKQKKIYYLNSRLKFSPNWELDPRQISFLSPSCFALCFPLPGKDSSFKKSKVLNMSMPWPNFWMMLHEDSLLDNARVKFDNWLLKFSSIMKSIFCRKLSLFPGHSKKIILPKFFRLRTCLFHKKNLEEGKYFSWNFFCKGNSFQLFGGVQWSYF